jgi:predicted PurR-regulated permease PerM
MVSFVVLVGVIAVIGFLFYRVISGFLLPMFLAALLVVVFQPWHRWFVVKLKGHVRVAAALTTASAVVVVLGPAALIIVLTIWELTSGASDTPEIKQAAQSSVQTSLSEFRKSLQSLFNTPVAKRRSGEQPRLTLDKPYLPEIRYIETSLASLRLEAQVGATYSGNAKALAKLLDALDDLQDRVVETEKAKSAESLAASLAPVRTALHSALTDPDTKPGSLHYQTLLEDGAHQFQAFKVAVFGNTLSVWLAELLNPTDDEIRSLTGQISAVAPQFLRSVGGKTGAILGNVLITIAVTLIAFFFFLADGPKMVRTLMRLSPLDDSHERELVAEFDRVSRAVVLATLLSAVAQGMLAGIAFWLISLSLEEFGFVFSLTLLTTVLALIPFVGAAAVWAPVSLWLFFHVSPDGSSHQLAAVLLAVYGVGVVSMADNVIKPLVLHGQSNLHPLLALLSILGGVQALGPIGILVGPMVVVFLQTLLNILHGELMALERRMGDGGRRKTLPFIFSLRQRRFALHYQARERTHRIY